MVLTIALLLFFQLAGTAIVTVTGLPIPGPVMGMLLFLFALMVKDNLLQQTLPVVNVLLAHFSLLFVPAGVGIMQHGAGLPPSGCRLPPPLSSQRFWRWPQRRSRSAL